MSFVSCASMLMLVLLLLPPCPQAQAQALVRMTEGGIQNLSVQAADPPPAPATPEEEDRLIDSYIKKAGKLGPRRWFTDTRVALRASVGEAYDDNILVSASRAKESDSVTTLAAGIGLAVGDFQDKQATYALVDYQATATLFGAHSEENAVDHAALADVQYRKDKLAARFTSEFKSLHDTSADLGQRTQRSIFDEAFGLTYNAGAYTRIEGGVRYNYSAYDGPIDTQDAAIELGADYLFFDKVRLGGVLTFGHTEADGGVQDNYEQFQARVEYEVSGQIKVSTRLGFETRQRDGGGGTAEPIFSLAGSWTPFGGTLLELSGYRRVTASASQAGDDILETGLHFTLRQRLVKRFYAQLDADYTHAEYQRATGGAAIDPRTDDYYVVRGAVGYDFVDWLKVQVFCQRREDDSTREEFSFESTRSGVQVDLAY